MGVADPEIIAATGWTTDELAAGIDRARPEGPYGLVSLLIGVNNQYRGLPLEEYREQFAALLVRAFGFAGGDARRVIVLSIPDWGVTPFAAGRDGTRIACEIDAFNQAAREIAVRAGAAFVDITPITRRAAHDVSLVAEDGLHPSGVMYGLWVDALLPVVVGAIET
jgi:lysophospholipase L1-like esterase